MFIDSDKVPFAKPLVNTGFEGISTIKEMFKDDPDTIVRLNPDNGIDFEKAIKSKAEYESLSDTYGIHIPKFEIVQGNEFYIVTKRVYGESLEQALTHPTPKLLNQVQSLQVRLLHYLGDRSNPGDARLPDIYALYQYMYGNLAGKTGQEIYLIDLELDVTEFTGDLWKVSWLDRVFDIAEGIVTAENISGQKLQISRQAIQKLLHTLPKERMYLQGSKMINEALKGKEIDDYEWEERLYS